MKNDAKWIWLANKCGIGSLEVSGLIEKFETIANIYASSYDDYVYAGVSERLAEDMCDKSLEAAYMIIKYCQSKGVSVLCYDDEDYPSSLRSLKNPPAVLYCMGKLPDMNKELCISIVGTRKMSEYGMRAAYKIAYEVAAAGAVVVSGMALGIDAVAASAAIAAGGRTVAVFGCGIDVVYPKEHTKLRDAIIANGAVITEYPPSTEPHGAHYPVRNRIISGLAQGVAVIDADMGSGALITAKKAIVQGKDLYAVPCNIDSENSAGTNSLIRDGASAILCGDDIISNYSYLFRDRLNIQKMRAAEKRSEFDPSVLLRMGVKARGRKPAFEGKSSMIERLEKENAETAIRNAAPQKTKKNESANSPVQKTVEEPCAISRAQNGGDESRAALESLSEKQRKIFEEMPLDQAITVDYLTKTGYKLGEVISALTMLEIKGLVSSLPGALYIRK